MAMHGGGASMTCAMRLLPCPAVLRRSPCTLTRGCPAGVEGSLNLRFGVPFGAACCAASLVGVVIISRIVRKSGKVRSPRSWCHAFA